MKGKMTIILALSLLLTACSQHNGTEVISEAPLYSDTVTVSETIGAADEKGNLEAIIASQAGALAEGEVQSPVYSDFDGDGRNELFAVYGKNGHGRLYFANKNGAFMLGNEAEWTDPKIVTVDGINLVYAEMLSESDSVSYYWQVIDGKPYRIDTCGLMLLEQTSDSEFTAYHAAYDAYADGILKPYYFYAVNTDGKISFREYYAWKSPAEEIPDYIKMLKTEQGYDLQPYLDEISGNGEITDLINRTELGIIHINYIVDGERFYRTLKLKDGIISDITPENNVGHYVHQVTSKYMLDVIIY